MILIRTENILGKTAEKQATTKQISRFGIDGTIIDMLEETGGILPRPTEKNEATVIAQRKGFLYRQSLIHI